MNVILILMGLIFAADYPLLTSFYGLRVCVIHVGQSATVYTFIILRTYHEQIRSIELIVCGHNGQSAPLFIVHCEGREVRFLHYLHRESIPRSLRGSPQPG